jgi:glycosyltransferase involved in cell wall biosynthesis
MRIFLVTPGFAANESDSDCIPPLQQYVAELARRGHDVHVVALEYPYTNKAYSCFGAQVYPCNGGNHWYTKLRTVSRAARIGEQIFTYGKPDVVHSFWYGISWIIGSGFRRTMQVPLVCTLMGQEVLKKADSIARRPPEDQKNMVVLSDFHQAYFTKRTGIMDNPLIPWGISRADIAADTRGERPIDVLGVGSCIDVKDWHTWINVFATIAEKDPQRKGVIIGSGKLLRDLKKLTSSLNLDKNIEFWGQMPRSEVIQTMHRSKVFLHTPKYESFGYVLVEAAAQGCHVVSKPVGIAAQIAECATDTDALALRVRWALERTAPQNPDTPYLMEDTVSAYEHLYRSV